MTMSKLNLNKSFERTYIMRHIDWNLVPECVKKDLIQIYRDFKKQYKPSLPTSESLKRAYKLLQKQSSDKLTVAEKKALKDVQRMPWISRLCADASNEYQEALCNVFGVPNLNMYMTLWSSTRKVVYLDHLLRHSCKMDTIQNLSKLRCKARKSAGLPKDGNVGF